MKHSILKIQQEFYNNKKGGIPPPLRRNGNLDAKMQIRLPKELYEEFKKIAKENAQVPSLLVRKWIENYVEENKRYEIQGDKGVDR